jgi:hypothetical protein
VATSLTLMILDETLALVGIACAVRYRSEGCLTQVPFFPISRTLDKQCLSAILWQKSNPNRRI